MIMKITLNIKNPTILITRAEKYSWSIIRIKEYISLNKKKCFRKFLREIVLCIILDVP